MLGLSFCRREEPQIDKVKTLMSELLEGCVSQSLTASVITTNGGYGMEMYVQLMSSTKLSSIFVMTNHLWKVHPFVTSSLLAPARDDDDDSEADEDTNEVDGSLQSFYFIRDGRRSAFVAQEAHCHGQAVFTAIKALNELGSQLQVADVTVIENVTQKKLKLLRIMHSFPPDLTKELKRWFSVRKPGVDTTCTLFFWSKETSSRVCEVVVSKHCVSLTLGHRCAYWFIVRLFLVTGTSTSLILKHSKSFLTAFYLYATTATDKKILELFCTV